MYTPIRWQQMFQNFRKAYTVFERRINDYEKDKKSEANQMSLIQAFEVLVELSWKTLKDYLANEGTVINSPKGVIRQAFQFDVIHNGEDWMEALVKRNLTTHTYDENISKEILIFIYERFSPIVKELHVEFSKELSK
jgi:nucleotidyltransferase substrate binding protein (TIGR01987 family)